MRSRCARARPTGGRSDVRSPRGGLGRLRAGSNKGGAPARLEHREGFLRHLAADGIEDGVAIGHDLREIAGIVVDDLVGAEAAHIVAVRRARGRDHAGADMLGQLDGEAGDAARPALDQDGFSGLELQGFLDRT